MEKLLSHKVKKILDKEKIKMYILIERR